MIRRIFYKLLFFLKRNEESSKEKKIKRLKKIMDQNSVQYAYAIFELEGIHMSQWYTKLNADEVEEQYEKMIQVCAKYKLNFEFQCSGGF